MKYLLVAINSKFIHTNPALYSLYAYASFYGDGLAEHMEIAEYTINHRTEDIVRGIYHHKPDVLGFSVYIWNVSYVMEVIGEIRKLLPDIPIWVGGPEVSYRPEEVLKTYKEITGVMVGEGEQTFKELLELYIPIYSAGHKAAPQEINYKDINGLAIRDGEEIFYTKTRELTDLSKLPFLYDDLEQFEHKIIYYETSRGCPFRCSYCLSSIDKKVRLRDIEMVKKELQFFLDQKVPQVKFIDRTFNCNHEHAMAIWKYIKEHDNKITNFHFEVGADLLRDDELDLLNTLRPGAVQMEIGVQSTNEQTIHEICRVMDIPKLKKIVERLHAGKNIHIHLDLIAGLPYEDYESFKNSFNDVYSMKPEQLQLGFLKVLSGSYMKEKVEEYGICYTTKPPYEVLFTKWISYEEVCKLKQIEEMVEIYYNSNQFTFTIPYLERFFETPFALYDALANFYEEEGYFINTPSRSYRYDVLLSFAKKYVDDEELVKELLTMDIYLRENAKSRPEFSKDLTIYKEDVNAFYRKEEKNRENNTHILKDYVEYEPRAMVRMLHIEPISYDLMGEKFGNVPTYNKCKERYVLFDYKDRNPLTYDAKIYILDSLV